MFPSWSWLEWGGDVTFLYWALRHFQNEGWDSFPTKDIGIAKHVNTRKSETEAMTVARASIVEVTIGDLSPTADPPILHRPSRA
jgi:hypothetical protein